jgi:hypothetical protein
MAAQFFHINLPNVTQTHVLPPQQFDEEESTVKIIQLFRAQTACAIAVALALVSPFKRQHQQSKSARRGAIEDKVTATGVKWTPIVGVAAPILTEVGRERTEVVRDRPPKEISSVAARHRDTHRVGEPYDPGFAYLTRLKYWGISGWRLEFDRVPSRSVRAASFSLSPAGLAGLLRLPRRAA